MDDGFPAAGALRLAEFLCFSVYSTGHAFGRVYKPLLDRLQLTYPQYLVMVILWEKDDQTVGEIGEKLFLESSTLTPLLKRLEALGHVARRRDKRDERQVRVSLTRKGRDLHEEAQDIPRCILDSSGMDAEDLLAIKLALDRLRDRLIGGDDAGPADSGETKRR